MDQIHQIIEFIVAAVSQWGYWGIFILMAIESSVIPLPSELVMIPAGYLIFKGEMEVMPVILSGTFGSLAGAIANYYVAKFVGRKFIKKYGKYFFTPPEKLELVEKFFHNHGSFSTFSGRLIPVVRHLISIPAGLASMNMAKFSFYTTTGACIWVCILTALGYFIGHEKELLQEYLHIITIGVIVCLAVFLVAYVKINKARKIRLAK